MKTKAGFPSNTFQIATQSSKTAVISQHSSEEDESSQADPYERHIVASRQSQAFGELNNIEQLEEVWQQMRLTGLSKQEVRMRTFVRKPTAKPAFRVKTTH